MNEIVLRILTSSPRTLPQLVILAFCIYYLVKQITVDGILLCFGSLIGNITAIFYVFIIPYLIQANGAVTMSRNQQMYLITGVVSLIGAIAFAVGFIILILKTVKHTKTLPISNANKQSKDLLIDDSL